MNFHLRAFFLAGAASFLVGTAATYTLYPPGNVPEGQRSARPARFDAASQSGSAVTDRYFKVSGVHHLFAAPPDQHPSAWSRVFSGAVYLNPEVPTQDISRSDPVRVALWSALATILLVFWFPGGMLLEEMFKDDPLTHILSALLGLWSGLFAAATVFTAEVTFDNAISAVTRVYVDDGVLTIPPQSRLTVNLRTGPHRIHAVTGREGFPAETACIAVEKGGDTVFNLWGANRYKIQRAMYSEERAGPI
jgi:hypothetical protein